VAKKRKRAAPGRAARRVRVKPATRRAIIHAYLSKRARKAARTRKRGGKKPKIAAPVEAVSELVLFEAGPDDAPPALAGTWAGFHPPVQGRFRLTVQHRFLGRILRTETLEVPETEGPFDWEAGTVPTQVRNVIRAWHEVAVTEERAAGQLLGDDSPAAELLRLAVLA